MDGVFEGLKRIRQRIRYWKYDRKSRKRKFYNEREEHRTAKNKAPDNRGILLHSLRENIQSKTKGSKSQDY